MPVPQAADEACASGAAFIEGEYLPVGESRLPLLDWGFIKSDCAYDVVGVWGGRFFRLDDHVERFHTSMERLHLVCPMDDTRSPPCCTTACGWPGYATPTWR